MAIEQAPPAPALDPGALAELMRKAAAGDEEALVRATTIFDAHPAAWEFIANLGLGARRAWVDLVASTVDNDPLFRRALERSLAALKQEVSGPAPSVLERLLAERIAVCWLGVEFAEEELARYNQQGGSLAHQRFYEERLDRVQRRYLNAIRSLAQVRRLPAPSIQVNVGSQQLNVAGR